MGFGVGFLVGVGVEVFVGVGVGVGVDVGIEVGVAVDVDVGSGVGVGQGSVKDKPLDNSFVFTSNLSYVFPPSGILAIDPSAEGIQTFPCPP